MVKFSSTLGLLAAAFTAASAAGIHHGSGVSTFNPVLKNSSGFKVYQTPITVNVDSTKPAAFTAPSKNDAAVTSKADIATAFLAKTYNIPANTVKITDAYTDSRSGITHVHVRQTINGVDVMNGLANVNIDSEGRVISSSNSFAPSDAISKVKRANGSLVARATDDASLKSSFKALTDYVKTTVSDSDLGKITVASTSSFNGESQYEIANVPKQAAVDGKSTATKAYIQTAEGKLVPVWHIVLKQENSWWSAHVSQDSNKVEAINDWVSHAEAYNVYPRTIDSPDEGKRTTVTDPADKTASSKGWVTGKDTRGNNVWAQDNPSGGDTWENNHRPSAKDGAFDFPLDLTQEPSKYIDAAITQLFYTVNSMHDLSYLYGFDEAAGNFQDENYSGKGKGKDYVVAFAQDGSGTDNANFATPPDGQNGVMRMYIWTQTTPNRDGDLQQDIVAHEFTHGISNRLTGGPSNADCLNDGEPGGMGEGWSDTVANLLRIKSGDKRTRDMEMGVYSYGKGIRNYPYSTSTTTNPNTYKTLDDPNYQEVHAIGEVWAEILYEVIWNLIDDNGIADDIFAHDLTKGNSIALQIILDGMKLQPCNPTFIDARDAIIQAEDNLTKGKNKCAIWKAFAKRGLGPKASGKSGSTHTEDKSLPEGCSA